MFVNSIVEAGIVVVSHTIDVENVFYVFFILVTFFTFLTFFYFPNVIYFFKCWQRLERQAD